MRFRMKWKDFICKKLSNDSVLCLIVNLSFYDVFFSWRIMDHKILTNRISLNPIFVYYVRYISLTERHCIFFPDNMIYMCIFINMPDVLLNMCIICKTICFVLNIPVVHYNIMLNKNIYCMLQWSLISLLFHADANYYWSV